MHTVIFDLDDTLTESKMPLTKEMGLRLAWLLGRCNIGIISGCAYEQFQVQFLEQFNQICDKHTWHKLFLMPTSGVQLYAYDDGGKWKRKYHSSLLLREKAEVYNSFKQATKTSGILPIENPHGEIAEDRGSQITFSMCGQQAPSHIKKLWDPYQAKRLALAACMDELLDEQYAVTVGGATSIDVSRRGQDKAYGVNKFLGFLHITDVENVMFVGDALYEGGNDYPVRSTGVHCVQTSGPKETIQIIGDLLEELNALV